ncbi:MAG TPA: hypothetical protein PLW99_02890 [Candidatus Paceibacterota bacterium]|nr:hypothetical protein [Candidatus Paceibacterota bacterium]
MGLNTVLSCLSLLIFFCAIVFLASSYGLNIWEAVILGAALVAKIIEEERQSRSAKSDG